MRILITGGCGFLGSHLVEHFLRAHLDDGDGETEIVVIDKLADACGFDRLREVTASSGLTREAMHARVRTLGGVDLDRRLTAGVMHEIGAVDYIIHVPISGGAHDAVDRFSGVESAAGQMETVFNLAMQIPDLRRVFVISTDAVYGQIDKGGHAENAPYRPASLYAASMTGMECVARAYRRAVRATIVTAPNLFGERQDSVAFLPMVIRKLLAGHHVPIRGGSRRQYMHCRTFASALEYLLEGDWHFARRDPPADLGLPLKIHVAGREADAQEFALSIATRLDRPFRWAPLMAGGDQRRALTDGLISEFEWKRPMDFEQQLDNTVNWYVNNPHWLKTSKE